MSLSGDVVRWGMSLDVGMPLGGDVTWWGMSLGGNVVGYIHMPLAGVSFGKEATE